MFAEMLHLCVDLLWDGVLLDPRMNLGQLLPLLLGEPRLEGLQHPQLLPVLGQHLSLVPGGARRQRQRQRRKVLQERLEELLQIMDCCDLCESVLPLSAHVCIIY